MYLFNAKIENPEKLEQMLVGREYIVNLLVEAQLQKTKGGLPPQFLVIGPRGSGKTHMLRVIYERLSRNASFMAEHEIAYMVEDESGIDNYFDLLQRILEALKRWSSDIDKTQFIIDKVEHLKGLGPKDWAKTAEKILRTFLKGKTLLVLIENFDWIMRGMDKKNVVVELAKLRDFIQQYQQVSFIATSQSLIYALSDDQNPLYGFFHVIQMQRLTLEESFEFIKKIASIEQDGDLIPFLESHEGRGHLEAIHQFTRGNHRLLLVFFDFLKAEFRSNLSDVFLKSIDELKPYYDSFIKNLAPQQQKIVQYLSLQRNPQKGADIGRNCFLDKNTVSKQLSELQRLGYVNAVNDKGRVKYYEITEPLLRMCFEINEDRNGIIKLFVNFLGQLYSSEQLKEKYLHYNYFGRFQPEPLRKQYQAEAKIYGMVKAQYLSTWTINEDDEKKLAGCCEPDETKKLIVELSHEESIGNIMDKIHELYKGKEWKKLITYLLQVLRTADGDANMYYFLGFAYYKSGLYEDSVLALKKVIDIKPNNETIWYNLGLTYSNLGEHEKSINSYKKSIEIKPNAKSWNNLGNSYAIQGEYKKAIEAFIKAIDIKPDAKSWNNLGNSYYNLREYNMAIDAYLKAIKIKPDAETWYSLGTSYAIMENYNMAINAYQDAIKIKPDEGIWYNMGTSYAIMEEYDMAIKAYQNAIEIKPEAKTWNNLGTSYVFKEEYEYAINAFQKAIKIKPDMNKAWFNLGVSYYNLDRYAEAKNAFTNANIYSDSNNAEDSLNNYSGLLEVTIKLKEFKEARAVIDQMFSNPDHLDYISKLENSILLLIKENSETEIKEIIIKLLNLCNEHQKLEKLSSLLSSVIFSLLKNHSDIKPHTFDILIHLFNELFKDKQEFTYPLRYLDIGIRYFVKEEKEAIYELSREERLLFEKFTLQEVDNK